MDSRCLSLGWGEESCMHSTFTSHKPGEVAQAIETSLKVGYRLFDCAHFYANEEEIGEAFQKCFKEGVVKREDVFITSKLWCSDMHPDEVHRACKLTLKNLQLEYLDLYLLHWPVTFAKSAAGKLMPDVTDEEKLGYSEDNIRDCWKKLEECVESGLVRSIGVSNFSITKTERLLKTAKILPSVNQVECNLYFQQQRLKEYCQSKGIVMEAYLPLRRTHPFKDPVLMEVAQKHGITVAQACLSFGLQCGLVLIPKSVTPSRITENFKSSDVTLDAEDMKRLKDLDKGLRQLTGKHVVKAALNHNEYLWDESEDSKYELKEPAVKKLSNGTDNN